MTLYCRIYTIKNFSKESFKKTVQQTNAVTKPSSSMVIFHHWQIHKKLSGNTPFTFIFLINRHYLLQANQHYEQ